MRCLVSNDDDVVSVVSVQRIKEKIIFCSNPKLCNFWIKGSV